MTALLHAATRQPRVARPANPYVSIYSARLDIHAGDFEAADRLLREH